MEINEFQRLNVRRCVEAFPACANWDLSDWMTAIAGEVGEAANLVKKINRGDFELDGKMAIELGKEIADVMTYCFIVLDCIGRPAEEALIEKFDEVSKRVNWRR